MCGLFGFKGATPDSRTLHSLAKRAETRGPHAFGFACPDEAGRWQVYKIARAYSSLVLSPFALPCHYTSPLIGQCRLATSGEWWDNNNNQPLTVGQICLAHNGNVYNYPEIYARSPHYNPSTSCDSEALITLIENYQSMYSYPLAKCVELADQAIDQTSPCALLVSDGLDLIAYRRGHPLYTFTRPEGTYICSRQTPAAALLPERHACTL